jgi:hypothetical protein
MTHKYERISKVIKETFGDDNNYQYQMIDFGNLVHFAYAILEEFDLPQETELEKSMRIIYAAYNRKLPDNIDKQPVTINWDLIEKGGTK